MGMATEKAPVKGKDFQFYMSTACSPTQPLDSWS